MAGLEILLVMSPGLTQEAYDPLIHALRAEGAEVTPVGFPCSGDAESLSGAVARAGAGREVVVVAHGIGATLALKAADDLDVRRWVLSGPVLGAVRSPALTDVVGLTLGRSRVELSALPDAVGDVWLGEGWRPLSTCVAPGLARDVQWWAESAHVPVDPSEIEAPVWVQLGLLDEVATLEATVPAARRFPDGTLVRPGVSRLDPVDYRHLDLIRAPAPMRLAVRAAVEGW